MQNIRTCSVTVTKCTQFAVGSGCNALSPNEIKLTALMATQITKQKHPLLPKKKISGSMAFCAHCGCHDDEHCCLWLS